MKLLFKGYFWISFCLFIFIYVIASCIPLTLNIMLWTELQRTNFVEIYLAVTFIALPAWTLIWLSLD